MLYFLRTHIVSLFCFFQHFNTDLRQAEPMKKTLKQSKAYEGNQGLYAKEFKMHGIFLKSFKVFDRKTKLNWLQQIEENILEPIRGR